MTKSLPGVADLRLGANHPRMWTRRVQGTVVNVGVKVLPWIPTPAKRILSAGRSVIIDGNTLDPTLQLMLSTSRIFGVDGLAVDDDIVASRAHARDMRGDARSADPRRRDRPVNTRTSR